MSTCYGTAFNHDADDACQFVHQYFVCQIVLLIKECFCQRTGVLVQHLDSFCLTGNGFEGIHIMHLTTNSRVS